jgi:hypothetical protein
MSSSINYLSSFSYYFLKDNLSDATFSRSSIHIHGQKYADLIN